MIIAWGLFIYGLFVVVVRAYCIVFKSEKDTQWDFLFGVFLALCSAQYIWG